MNANANKPTSIQDQLTRAMRTRMNLYGYGFGDAADVLYQVPKLLDRIETLERELEQQKEPEE